MEKQTSKLIVERIFWALVVFGIGLAQLLFHGSDPIYQFKDMVLFITTILAIILITQRHPGLAILWVIVYDLGAFIAQIIPISLFNGTFSRKVVVINLIMDLFPMPQLGIVVIAALFGRYLHQKAISKSHPPSSTLVPANSNKVTMLIGLVLLLIPFVLYYLMFLLRIPLEHRILPDTKFFSINQTSILLKVWFYTNLTFAPFGAILILIGLIPNRKEPALL